ncbi:MAG: hypothetical protein RMI34_01515 [Chloroherpetonaceae bacterium]|nr:hypothetical protein [Chloroherpetonaceae bacterium]MCS7212129.1 hypothetical protein [Chloroherpetonaceae bacterium]MDW8018734.1 hypothetical protein [Chloroherpetonaceae bacterium]MDW8465922.1 hypothetical protein [Chloroherpetonaceae bacterium]
MGIASLVLGIIAFLISWIPCVNWFALLPAAVGLILGIVEAVQQNNAKAKGDANASPTLGYIGTGLNAVSIILIIVITVLLGRGLEQAAKEAGYSGAKEMFEEIKKGIDTVRTALEPEKVTKANYDRIQPGMTVSEVETILGKTTLSEDLAKSGAQDKIPVILTWKLDGFRFATVTFENGKVKEKSQIGLE